jgi:UDP-N-acetylmuramate dehydrogenase
MKYESEYLKNEPLGKYTTVGIGGPAEYLALPKNSDELVKYYLDAKKSKIPVKIIGSGSTFLIPDNGIKGLVIVNKEGEIRFDGEKVTCDSGVKLQRLCIESFNQGLIGLEYFAGIPCTVGGAVYNGTHGHKGLIKGERVDTDIPALFSDYIERVEYLDENGNISIKNHKDCEFGYGASWFQGKTIIITKVHLRLKYGDGTAARNRWSEIGRKKLESQEQRSMGCVFKNFTEEQREKHNFPTTSAGWFIEEKLKMDGYKIGDAKVSSKHHNFIVNSGNATAKDYLQVIKDIENKAKDEFGVELEREIEVVGNFS